MLFGSGILLLVAIAFWIWAIIDAFVSDPQKVRFLPKAAWIVIILLLMDIGALMWLVLGRSHGVVRAATGSREAGPTSDTGWTLAGSGPSGRSRRPIAPDDDPEFLRGLHNRLHNDKLHDDKLHDDKPDDAGDDPRS